jgi:hypothetical protein
VNGLRGTFTPLPTTRDAVLLVLVVPGVLVVDSAPACIVEVESVEDDVVDGAGAGLQTSL